MKIENQVTSLKLSKKLKELKVEQDSYFYWYGDEQDKMFLGDIDKTMKVLGTPFDGLEQEDYQIIYSAYTVAEIENLLPPNIIQEEKLYWLRIEKEFLFNEDKTPLYITYYVLDLDNKELLFRINNKQMNPADSRAKMLIYLIENNLITL